MGLGRGRRPSSANAEDYRAAFPAVHNRGCSTTDDDADGHDCAGYELENDLDFDTDGDGATHADGAGDPHDAYHNDSAGWTPVGTRADNHAVTRASKPRGARGASVAGGAWRDSVGSLAVGCGRVGRLGLW